MKPLYTLCLAILIAGCGRHECARKPIAELKSMSRDSLLFELCSTAGGANAAMRDSDRPRIIDCVDYASTIINVLRKDHKVEVAPAYRKGLEVGVTACLEEAKAQGFYDAGKEAAAETGRMARN